MSYDLNLYNICDHRVKDEDKLVEDNKVSVILNRPISNTSNVKVKINDFVRNQDFMTEVLFKENVTAQFTVTNTDTINVSQVKMYNGMKIGILAQSSNDFTVRIKVTEENASGQFTGIENFFYTQGKPILTSGYDFVTADKLDIEVKINSVLLDSSNITDIDPISGRIQLKLVPLDTDTVTITYYYKAAIKSFDPINGIVILKQKPTLNQEVYIAYYAQVSDGWYLENSQRSPIAKSKDVVFYRPKNSMRYLVTKENVSSQFFDNFGTSLNVNYFQVAHYPLLPLYQSFGMNSLNTLNNAVTVFLNGEKIDVMSIEPEVGLVALYYSPQKGDVIECTYYYQEKVISDRISVSYSTNIAYCQKCATRKYIWDYTYDVLNNYEKVINEYKLVQDLKKIIVTIKGTDKVATWYGTTFEQIIAKKMDLSYMKTRISGEISDALKNLKQAQVKQSNYQTVTDREFLDYIQSLIVNQDIYDPTYFTATVSVVTQSGKAFDTVIPLKG